MFDHDHGFEIMWGPCPKCGIDWRETDADHPEAANPLPIIDYPPPTTSTNPEPKPMTPDTAAGKALLDHITWLRHTEVDAAYECVSGVDRCGECEEDHDLILAIEAQAVAAFVWERLEATPGFNEEMAAALADVKAGRVTKWSDVKARLDEEGYEAPRIEAEARREPLALLRALVACLSEIDDYDLDAFFGMKQTSRIMVEARAYLAALPEQEVEG